MDTRYLFVSVCTTVFTSFFSSPSSLRIVAIGCAVSELLWRKSSLDTAFWQRVPCL